MNRKGLGRTDDYVLKPIKPKVLMSRIKALLKRAVKTEDTEEGIINAGPLKIDLKKHIVFFGELEVNLPKKEFNLLTLLCKNKGEVKTREEIMDQVWGTEVVVGDRTIDVHIRKLREKLGDELITTIKSVGLIDLDEDGICDTCLEYDMIVVDCACDFFDPATYSTGMSNSKNDIFVCIYGGPTIWENHLCTRSR